MISRRRPSSRQGHPGFEIPPPPPPPPWARCEALRYKVVRALGPRLVSGCGPGTRATCSAVLFGAFEAYPPLGTTPGVPGRELVAVCELMRYA
jgi:hypothetical protein